MTLASIAMMSPEEIRSVQNRRLGYFVRHMLPFSPFYRDFFQKHDLSFSDIRTIDDLQRLPLISKSDLIPTDEDPEKPRRFILQPDAALIRKYYPKSKLVRLILSGHMKEKLEEEFKPIHITFTTGRSAAQIPFLYTQYDLDQLSEVGRRVFGIAGLSHDDVVVNAFPFAPHLAFWLAQRAAEAVNVRALHTGGGKIMGTQKIISSLVKMKATVLISMPGYGYHLLRTAHEDGIEFPNLRQMIFGGERVSPGLREKIRQWYPNLRILSTFAFTESKTAWVQCHEESGYHLYPDLGHIELVDKEGNPVPEGTPGEIVYTALDWRGSAVLRYRTRDICQGYTTEPCPHCHLTLPRLHYDIQRQSEFKELQITKVKGELVNLNEFYNILHSIPEIEEWQVEIRKKNDDVFEVDELHIHFSCSHGKGCDKCEGIIYNRVMGDIDISPVTHLETTEIMLQRLGLEKELKETRVSDLR